jgi:DNA polymerase alpha subunit A
MASGRQIHIGQEIPYVLSTDGGSMAERARHPDEMKLDPTLKVDYEWYKSNQLHPVIMRLCAPIESIAPSTIAESLGLDGSKFRASAPVKLQNEEELDTRLQNAGELYERLKTSQYWPELPACIHCKKSVACPTVFATHKCDKCQQDLPVTLVENYLRLCTHGLANAYFDQSLQCDEEECRRLTRQVAVFGNGTRCQFGCLVGGNRCTGKMLQVFSDLDFSEHLKLLKQLVIGEVSLEGKQLKPTKEFTRIIDAVTNSCEFNFVNLQSIFGVMSSSQRQALDM